MSQLPYFTRVIRNITGFVCIALLLPFIVKSAERMPAELAGEIGRATGQIAFIRDKNIWIMDAFGGHQRIIAEIGNADGRMSWSPDGKRIAFTRSGSVDLKGPDNMGGRHKVYDIFLAYIDSADANNTNFWYRLTDDLGGRDPEWSADGKTILFYKDVNANVVNAAIPNYQTCTMDDDGDNVEILRKDWRNMIEFFIAPTMSPTGEIAFVHFIRSEQGYRPQGIATLPRNKFMASLNSVGKISQVNSGLVAPAYSPDGKWLAFMSNSITNPAVFIAPVNDLTNKYEVFVPPPGTGMFTTAPSFSPNSKFLTFCTSDGSIWTCDITGGNKKKLTGPGKDYAPAWSKGGIKK